MTHPEEAIYTILQQAPGFTTKVADRVFPVKAPQQCTRPYVTYLRQSSMPEHHLSDPQAIGSNTVSGLRAYHFLIKPSADSYLDMRDTSEQIRLALDGFCGRVVCPSGNFDFNSITLVSDADHFDEPIGDNDTGTYANIMHFTAFAAESLPLPKKA